MARIKIKDLPKDMKISAEEMRIIHAGATYDPSTFIDPGVLTHVRRIRPMPFRGQLPR